jgi:hypothetical protein
LFLLVADALITYSPSDNRAGIESDVPEPGPDMYPPVANSAPDAGLTVVVFFASFIKPVILVTSAVNLFISPPSTGILSPSWLSGVTAKFSRSDNIPNPPTPFIKFVLSNVSLNVSANANGPALIAASILATKSFDVASLVISLPASSSLLVPIRSSKAAVCPFNIIPLFHVS